jgi:hypothetical protein
MVQTRLDELQHNGIITFDVWASHIGKFQVEDSLQLMLDCLAKLNKMEIKSRFSLSMMECIIICEELEKAGKEMGFKMARG